MNCESISGLIEGVIGHPSGSLNEGRDFCMTVLIYTIWSSIAAFV